MNPTGVEYELTHHASRLEQNQLMLRISQNGQEPIIDVDEVDGIAPAIRSRPPGLYHVLLSADPVPSGHTSRHWGVVVKWRDGWLSSSPIAASVEQIDPRVPRPPRHPQKGVLCIS
jgi:hypothetical protein